MSTTTCVWESTDNRTCMSLLQRLHQALRGHVTTVTHRSQCALSCWPGQGHRLLHITVPHVQTTPCTTPGVHITSTVLLRFTQNIRRPSLVLEVLHRRFTTDH